MAFGWDDAIMAGVSLLGANSASKAANKAQDSADKQTAWSKQQFLDYVAPLLNMEISTAKSTNALQPGFRDIMQAILSGSNTITTTKMANPDVPDYLKTGLSSATGTPERVIADYVYANKDKLGANTQSAYNAMVKDYQSHLKEGGSKLSDALHGQVTSGDAISRTLAAATKNYGLIAPGSDYTSPALEVGGETKTIELPWWASTPQDTTDLDKAYDAQAKSMSYFMTKDRNTSISKVSSQRKADLAKRGLTGAGVMSSADDALFSGTLQAYDQGAADEQAKVGQLEMQRWASKEDLRRNRAAEAGTNFSNFYNLATAPPGQSSLANYQGLMGTWMQDASVKAANATNAATNAWSGFTNYVGSNIADWTTPKKPTSNVGANPGTTAG